MEILNCWALFFEDKNKTPIKRSEAIAKMPFSDACLFIIHIFYLKVMIEVNAISMYIPFTDTMLPEN